MTHASQGAGSARAWRYLSRLRAARLGQIRLECGRPPCYQKMTERSRGSERAGSRVLVLDPIYVPLVQRHDLATRLRIAGYLHLQGDSITRRGAFHVLSSWLAGLSDFSPLLALARSPRERFPVHRKADIPAGRMVSTRQTPQYCRTDPRD